MPVYLRSTAAVCLRVKAHGSEGRVFDTTTDIAWPLLQQDVWQCPVLNPLRGAEADITEEPEY